MADDIRRFGEGQLEGDYYEVRESVASIGGYLNSATADQAAFYFIDGLGKAQRVAVGRPGARTEEEIAQLPTKGEAIAKHLGPAFERAQRNKEAWLREQENQPKPEPKPPPMDPDTRRFLEGEDSV